MGLTSDSLRPKAEEGSESQFLNAWACVEMIKKQRQHLHVMISTFKMKSVSTLKQILYLQEVKFSGGSQVGRGTYSTQDIPHMGGLQTCFYASSVSAVCSLLRPLTTLDPIPRHFTV